MKILLVSDLHYTLKQLDWVHQVAGQFDMIVIAGDHLDISSVVDIEAQIVVILKYLDRIKAKTRLLVSSGNHDLNAENASNEKVAAWMSRVRQLGVVADGETHEQDGRLFTVCPWWDGPVTRAEVDAQFAADAPKAATKDEWLWIYHSPPDESPVSWAGSRHFGDTDIVDWIHRYEPAMVMTGHIHQSPFRKGGSWVDRIGPTWVFNTGRQIGPVPCHCIIDTDERKAMWFSLAGSEVVDLDKPLTRPVPEFFG
jgi:Icc-related predicted phosphoesterase